MDKIEFRIVRLPPMRVAWVHATGEAPEMKAWERLRAWAEPRGLLDRPDEHPIFGFNNPNPTPGEKVYGYEFWIVLGPETDAEGVGVKEVEGGRYAVSRCKLDGDPAGPVPQVWRKLWEWVQASEHRWRRTTHELERAHDPRASEEDMVLDLCLPIEE